MIKKLLFLMLILSVNISYAQVDYTQFIKDGILELKHQAKKKDPVIELRIPLNEHHEIVYEKVYQLENSNAHDIYDRARVALTSMYYSAKYVKQLEDDENKIIILNGKEKESIRANAFFVFNFDVKYSMKIECRDNRYKVSIYAFRTHWVYTTIVYNISNTTTADIDDRKALKYGIVENGYLNKKILEGLTFLAWDNLGRTCLNTIENLMIKVDTNKSNDW